MTCPKWDLIAEWKMYSYLIPLSLSTATEHSNGFLNVFLLMFLYNSSKSETTSIISESILKKYYVKQYTPNFSTNVGEHYYVINLQILHRKFFYNPQKI